jgi:hypothetical protein
MSAPIIEQVVEQLKGLPDELQRRVLEFTRALVVSTPHGTPGRELLRFVGTIPKESAELMRQAIEEDCERIDADKF